MATVTGADKNHLYYDDPDVAGLQQVQVGIQTQRIQYKWTQTDHDRGFAVVHVFWPKPFDDLNYTVAWGIEDFGVTEEASYWQGDIHARTAAGFDAIVYVYTTGMGTVGDVLTVHAIGIHD